MKYHVAMGRCSYTGGTKRTLETRMKKHRACCSPLRTAEEDSSCRTCLAGYRHTIDRSDVRILDEAPGSSVLLIKLSPVHPLKALRREDQQRLGLALECWVHS